MQTEDSQKVIKRFFEALYYLKDMKIIRGKQTFTNEFGINRWNLNTLEKDMSRHISGVVANLSCAEVRRFLYLASDGQGRDTCVQ